MNVSRNLLKPYSIVNVDKDGYKHFGEVMSFPICDTDPPAIMVRRVPGHPGTLEELPIDVLSTPMLGRVKYVHYAAVDGSGSFPVDMLRYDSAAPLNFTLGTERGKPVVIESFGFEQLVVAYASSHKAPNWTVARWSSFNWGLRPLHTETLAGGA